MGADEIRPVYLKNQNSDEINANSNQGTWLWTGDLRLITIQVYAGFDGAPGTQAEIIGDMQPSNTIPAYSHGQRLGDAVTGVGIFQFSGPINWIRIRRSAGSGALSVRIGGIYN